MADYYQIPFRFNQLTERQDHPKCELAESVVSMLHLITITHFGECKFDETFGCEIWEHDFENITNTQLYKEQLRKSIQQTIEVYEPRLSISRVDIQIEQVDSQIGKKRTKSRINLHVKGTLSKTNEPFSFKEQFYIGPLSYTL